MGDGARESEDHRNAACEIWTLRSFLIRTRRYAHKTTLPLPQSTLRSVTLLLDHVGQFGPFPFAEIIFGTDVASLLLYLDLSHPVSAFVSLTPRGASHARAFHPPMYTQKELPYFYLAFLDRRPSFTAFPWCPLHQLTQPVPSNLYCSNPESIVRDEARALRCLPRLLVKRVRCVFHNHSTSSDSIHHLNILVSR